MTKPNSLVSTCHSCFTAAAAAAVVGAVAAAVAGWSVDLEAGQLQAVCEEAWVSTLLTDQPVC